ncbi:MAG: HU family DNA-binding protein [Bdellovibrionota bacterium]
MTKAELIEQVAKANKGLSKRAVEGLLNVAFKEIAKGIKKNKRFVVPGFGTFKVRDRAERKGRNPKTGEEIMIPASRTVGFKPAPALKGSL